MLLYNQQHFALVTNHIICTIKVLISPLIWQGFHKGSICTTYTVQKEKCPGVISVPTDLFILEVLTILLCFFNKSHLSLCVFYFNQFPALTIDRLLKDKNSFVFCFFFTWGWQRQQPPLLLLVWSESLTPLLILVRGQLWLLLSYRLLLHFRPVNCSPAVENTEKPLCLKAVTSNTKENCDIYKLIWNINNLSNAI